MFGKPIPGKGAQLYCRCRAPFFGLNIADYSGYPALPVAVDHSCGDGVDKITGIRFGTRLPETNVNVDPTTPIVNVNVTPEDTPVFGTAIIDFGDVPTFDTSVLINYQTDIPADAHIRAWIQDDLIAAELITLTPINPIAGTGFTIYAASLSAMVIGQVPIHWSWNS